MLNRLVLSMLLASALGACGNSGIAPDAGLVDVPLEREHAGGSPSAIALVGTRAYIAVGPRLTVWDLASTPPHQVGESAALRGVISAVAITGTHAYVSERIDLSSLIHVFDVSSTTPVEVNAFSLATSGSYSVVRDLEVGASRLYVADQEQGVLDLDLAVPTAPTMEQLVPMMGVYGLTLVGTRLYYTVEDFTDGATVGALDLENAFVDMGSSSLGNMNGVAFTGELAVGAGPGGIYVFDVSNPADAAEQFHYGDHGAGPFAGAVAVRGSKAWIPEDEGLHIIDLEWPITHTGTIPLSTANVNAAVANARVLATVTDRGKLFVVDVAPNPTREPQAVDVTLCADCVGAAVRESTLYVADHVGGVRTAQLSNLASIGRSIALPVVPGTGGLQFVLEDVDVTSTNIFVADWLYGLRVFDQNIAKPHLVASLATGRAPSSVRVIGDRAYITEATNGGFLRILDISDPATPILLGSARTSKAMDVEVRGSVAFVADETLFGSGGLRIFDVSNPAAITQLGLYNEGCPWASDVAISGGTAIVACGSDGFHAIDVSEPTAPVRIALMKPGISAVSVATWDGHAVLGHDRGVTVVSLDAVPQIVGSYATAWPVRALSVPTPGRIVAAAGSAGMYQWQLPGYGTSSALRESAKL